MKKLIFITLLLFVFSGESAFCKTYKESNDYRNKIKPLEDKIVAEKQYELGETIEFDLEKDQAFRLNCRPNNYIREIFFHRTSFLGFKDILMTYVVRKHGTVNERGPGRDAFRIIGSNPGVAEYVS